MNTPMNRRRFLELSNSFTALAAPGCSLENLSPQVSEITFAATSETDEVCDQCNDNQESWTRSNFVSRIDNMVVSYLPITPKASDGFRYS